MVSRRGYLGGLGVAIAGVVAYLEYQPAIADPISGPPARDTEVATVEPRGQFTKLVFYESGAVDVHFTEDHGCYTQLEISHTDSESVYASYDAPEFAGPITIDLKGVLNQHGPFPSRKFQFELTAGDSICLTPGGTAYVTVPESYV